MKMARGVLEKIRKDKEVKCLDEILSSLENLYRITNSELPSFQKQIKDARARRIAQIVDSQQP